MHVQGGFARVYEVCDSRDNRLACKVVTKSSLKTKKAKTKVRGMCPTPCNIALTLCASSMLR